MPYTLMNLDTQKLLTSDPFVSGYEFGTYLTTKATTWSSKGTVQLLQQRYTKSRMAVIDTTRKFKQYT